MHVITGVLMGEVQAARGMSSKGSQRMAGQDVQRTQAPIYCWSPPCGEFYGWTEMEEVGT